MFGHSYIGLLALSSLCAYMGRIGLLVAAIIASDVIYRMTLKTPRPEEYLLMVTGKGLSNLAKMSVYLL